VRRIRADERTALLPVVVLTTSKEHQDIFEAYRLGANSYIRKPVDFERFLQAVGQLGCTGCRSTNPPTRPPAESARAGFDVIAQIAGRRHRRVARRAHLPCRSGTW
jgi:DNA-binding NarL/FixJ family response regulator